jgi:hypothetical protein
MNMAERLMKKVLDLAKFCPICATELIVVEHRWNADKAFQKKVCPTGHGEMDVDADGELGPEAVFTVNNELLIDVD